jgi:hypothetical protein
LVSRLLSHGALLCSPILPSLLGFLPWPARSFEIAELSLSHGRLLALCFQLGRLFLVVFLLGARLPAPRPYTCVLAAPSAVKSLRVSYLLAARECNAPNFAVEFFSFLYSPKFGRYLFFFFFPSLNLDLFQSSSGIRFGFPV